MSYYRFFCNAVLSVLARRAVGVQPLVLHEGD